MVEQLLIPAISPISDINHYSFTPLSQTIPNNENLSIY